MSNAPQGQKPQAEKNVYSNQSNDGKTGNNTRKDEPSEKSGKDDMEGKNESGSASGNKSSKA